MEIKLIAVIELSFKSTSIQGTNFFELNEVADDTLIEEINAHFTPLQNDTELQEECCSLFGGFILSINFINELYPQCCGELSDWKYWDSIINKGKPTFYNGHPAPEVSFSNGFIYFKCIDDDDPFHPLTKKEIKVPITELKIAYEEAMKQLEDFKTRIETLAKHINSSLDAETLAHILVTRNLELDE